MKHLISLAALRLTPLAALAALIFLPAMLQAQTLTLKDADTIDAAVSGPASDGDLLKARFAQQSLAESLEPRCRKGL
jgi:hypothetical protein